jgi:alpha-glucosidase
VNRPQPAGDAPWWKNAVVYQIYPRSFASSDNSGIGNLPGITARLDYLEWLGIDAIWLSPFFRSPMRDFGYDVSDYCDVDPIFGSLADFDALLQTAHAKGIRVLIDWVPAHTSSDHPWFVQARASKDDPRRDWYVWRDPGPEGTLPNNWVSALTDGAPAWTLDASSGQYYLHSFLPEQPDLNWQNPEVVAAMHQVLRFWLDRGVDGFRADVVHNIGKDPELRDADPELAGLPHCVLNDEPVTHGLLRDIRAVLNGYPGDRVIVGEVFLLRTEQVASYYGKGDELHLSFNFPPLFARWQAEGWRQCLETTFAVLDPVDAWPTWVLSNHDVKRHRTRYESEARARAAAVLLLTLRGTPFVYMGEELGLEDAEVPEARVVDPGGRDGARAPLPWDDSRHHGWGGEPWLPWPPQLAARNVAVMRQDEASILHLYRRLLRVRRESLALRTGNFQFVPADEGLLAYWRQAGDERCLVVINFRDQPARLEAKEPLVIRVASDGVGETTPFSGDIGPDQALLLCPPDPAASSS